MSEINDGISAPIYEGNFDEKLKYEGIIDASSNPDYPVSMPGDFYIISVEGKIGGESGVIVKRGDTIICESNNKFKIF